MRRTTILLTTVLAATAAAQEPGMPPAALEPGTPSGEQEPGTPAAAFDAEAAPGSYGGSDDGGEHVIGHVGVGYFTTTAPLGIRYWFTGRSGIDAGLGFSVSKQAVPEGQEIATDFGLGFEIGYLHSLARSKNLNLFLRPGLGVRFKQIPTGAVPEGGPVDAETTTDFDLNANLSLGGEMFLGGLGLPNVSLTAGAGVAVALDAPEDNNTGFGFALYHTGASVVSTSALVGVHFYF